MAPQEFKIRVNAFYGDNEIGLTFPENWQVTECLMAGHDQPALSDEEMRQALQSPIGSPRLSELAKGKKQVCILFDDIPKPTPAYRIVPFVLEELHAGGITDDQIRFVCAPGTHRPLLFPELVAKLGRDIVERFPVYNHCIWENLVNVGTTSRGTPMWVNREFASCDLRLGIGSLFPHPHAGFGGGGKLVLPGIAGIETVNHHHKHSTENSALGRVDDNVFRLDIEEATRLAGLHFKVDSVLNNRREVVAMFAGDFVAEHRAGVEVARKTYVTDTVEEADVVVANSYPDECQTNRATWVVPSSLKEGGDVVLISHSYDGQCLHQYAGRFGTDYGGRGYTPRRIAGNLGKANRTIVFAPNLSWNDREMIGPPDKVDWHRTWDEVLADLERRHGPGTRVALYPYAPLQMPVSSMAWAKPQMAGRSA